MVDTTIEFAITLPVTAAFELRDETTTEFDITLVPPWLSMVLAFDNAVSRGLRASVDAPWQKAEPLLGSADCRFQQAAPMPVQTEAPWQLAARRPGAPTADHWQPGSRTARPLRGASWQEGARRAGAPTADHWQEMDRRKRPISNSQWQEGTRRPGLPVNQPWQEMTRTSRPQHTAPWSDGTRRSQVLRSGAGQGTAAWLGMTSPWQEGRLPPPGRTNVVPPEPPVGEPCYTPPAGLAVELLFDTRWDGAPNLFFVCKKSVGPPTTVVVPIRRVYMVSNSVSLIRVSDGAPVKTDSLTLQLDYRSWVWGFSAAVPASMLALVGPTEEGPVELLAEVNGMQFRLLAERVGRDRAFRSDSMRVQGRGLIALLGEDYAPQLSFANAIDRNAQQLMADVLTLNGVPLDWTVDWQLEDWLVPAGAWSHYGNYISALNAIAQAAGGYLLPHASARSFKVLHSYPLAPWQWPDATPDLVLPADVAMRESRDWTFRPAYNRVFVQGQGQGLLGQVTREGTAGDLVAPLVVDPLMTAVAAVRQRGRAELSRGGRQIEVGLGLPVLAETGIVLPGAFVDYTDEAGAVRGLVRSVSVQAAFPNVWQTIGVETRV
jgi:hypothetical protein